MPLKLQGSFISQENHSKINADSIVTKTFNNVSTMSVKTDKNITRINHLYCEKITRKSLICTTRNHSKTLECTLEYYENLTRTNTNSYNKIRHDLRRGDVVGAKGYPGRSRKGELSLFPTEFKILTPCLHMLPSRYTGLKDKEVRFRKRHLDLIMNKDVRNVFITRGKIVNYVRKFLNDRDFLEVETPMMSDLAGGATATPFVTHHKTMNKTMYMRVAPELYVGLVFKESYHLSLSRIPIKPQVPQETRRGWTESCLRNRTSIS